MNVKKTIKRMIALGTGLTMVGATIFGASAVSLADYPAPFVENGRVNTLLLVGDNAASADVLGGIDIATTIQAVVGMGAVAGAAAGAAAGGLVGDVKRWGDNSDMLEVNENLGDVEETLDEFSLNALRGGVISTNEGTTDYNQYLRFQETGTNAFNTTGEVRFDKDEENEVGDFLYFDDTGPAFEYEIEFEEGLESDIQSGELEDLEDEVFTIMGDEFSITDTEIDTSSDRVELELISGAILDTLEEGETKTYRYLGRDEEVNVLIICDECRGGEGTAKFRINGFVTDELSDGETDTLDSGLEIGIREILPNEAEEISGGDLVEFFLGANKIELTDSNYTDEVFDGKIEIKEENIDDGDIVIQGSVLPGTTDKFEITNIKYRLTADAPKGNVYIKPGQGLREYLDEPEGMLNPNWDMRYEGLTDTGVSIIKFDAAGDDSYDIRFTNKEGLDYTVPLVDNSNDDDLGFNLGDEDDLLFHIEASQNDAANIAEDSYMIFTDDCDETGRTHVATLEDIDTSDNLVTFNDLATGQREFSYTRNDATNASAGGEGEFIVGGNTFKIFIGNGTSPSITADLNNDGLVNSAASCIVVQGGGIIRLGWQAVNSTNSTMIQKQGEDIANNSFNISLTTLEEEFDESGGGNEVITIEIIARNSEREVDLAVRGTTVNMISLDEVDLKQGLSNYGVFLEQTDDSDNDEADELTIEYPLSQRGAEVYVVYGDVSGSSGAGASAAPAVNVQVGNAKLASEVADITAQNAIVVGGPCANDAAAELMGNPEECWTAIDNAIIKLFDHGNGNYALLVAGRTALDTRRASRVLARYGDYALSGDEVEVTGTSMSDIHVSVVS